MGDGINDASSLHAADVGISVATAVDLSGKQLIAFTLLRRWVQPSGLFLWTFFWLVFLAFATTTYLVLVHFVARKPRREGLDSGHQSDLLSDQMLSTGQGMFRTIE
jgi:magnesium-transporting ATPase (P-type)